MNNSESSEIKWKTYGENGEYSNPVYISGQEEKAGGHTFTYKYAKDLRTEQVLFTLRELERNDWPPRQWVNEKGKAMPSMTWTPEDIESNSTKWLAIHKLVILKELGQSIGSWKKIDLFTWYWKPLIEEYISNLAPYPGEAGNFPPFQWKEKNSNNLVPIDPNDPFFRGMPQDEIKDICAFDAAIFPAHTLHDVFGDTMRGRLTLKCPESFAVRDNLRVFNKAVEERIMEFGALRLHLMLWWGWRANPFYTETRTEELTGPVPCMLNLLENHVAHMVTEGYLRVKANEKEPRYQLTESGFEKLNVLLPGEKETAKTWLPKTVLSTIGTSVLSSVCQSLFQMPFST